MAKLVINAALRTALAHLQHPTELCDESGTVLGYFTPWSEVAPPGVGMLPDSDRHAANIREDDNEVVSYLEML